MLCAQFTAFGHMKTSNLLNNEKKIIKPLLLHTSNSIHTYILQWIVSLRISATEYNMFQDNCISRLDTHYNQQRVTASVDNILTFSVNIVLNRFQNIKFIIP